MQGWAAFEMDLLKDPNQPVEAALGRLYILEPGLKEWKEANERKEAQHLRQASSLSTQPA